MMLSFISGRSQWKVKGQQTPAKEFIFFTKKGTPSKVFFKKLPTLFERYANYVSMLLLFLTAIILSNTSY